jgi:hypothetical protein
MRSFRKRINQISQRNRSTSIIRTLSGIPELINENKTRRDNNVAKINGKMFLLTMFISLHFN